MHASITGLNQAMCNLAGKMQFFYQKPCQEKYAIILLNSYHFVTVVTLTKGDCYYQKYMLANS